MKAERRHELQHNELADWVAETVERVKPYSRAIVGVIVAATVLVVTYVVLSGRSERKQATAWTDFYLAIEAPKSSIESELEAVVRDHESVAAGRWAEVTLADLQLGEGLELLFSDKKAADKKLQSSVEHYEAILKKAEDPLLVARARFGLGRAEESLGRLDEARAAYEEVVNASGTNAYVALAKARLADLKRDSTRDFYAWFAKQEPVIVPPESSSLPGTPGQKPPFDAGSLSLPDNIDLSGDDRLKIPGLEKNATGPSTSPETKNDKGATDVAPASKTEESSAAKSNSAADSAKTDETPKEPPSGSEKRDDTKAGTEPAAAKNGNGKTPEDHKDGKKDAAAGDGPAEGKSP